MAGKIVTVALTLFVGCLAVPTPEAQDEDMSQWFIHADPEARIMGGVQAPAGSHPHMVALTNGLLMRNLLCGGSLIAPRTVLTAAHCIDAVFSGGSLSSNLRVTVGTNRWSSGGQTYTVSRNVTHPNYVSAIIKNDIGVLITSNNVAYNALVSPIAVTYDYIPDGVPSRVAGWGRVRANGALSATLLQVDVPTMDGQRCVDAVRQAAIDFNTRGPTVEPHVEVCTFHSAGMGTCNGDSGSALQRLSDGRQYGIVSWGFPCARGAPDVFTRVSAYRDWLLPIIV